MRVADVCLLGTRPSYTQDVTLTLRQNSADGPKVVDVALTREEVPLKPKVRL
jgi:hypothetical protein